jgi:hypothetical protein
MLVMEGRDLLRIAIFGGVIGFAAFCASYCLLVWHTKLRARCNSTDRNKLDAILKWSYVVDVYVLPLMNFTALFACLFMIASEGFLAGYAFAWFLAISLLNFMTATFYILSQGDEFPLLATVVALDLYQCLLINSVWVAAVADELRKSEMRW